MTKALVKNYKGLSGLCACKCCYFENLLAGKWSIEEHGVHWSVVAVCVYVKTFWLLFILFIPISCFKFTFSLKATMGCTLLYVSLKLLLMPSMFQCLFIISFIFGNTGLYVTKNGIYIWVYNVLKAIIYLRDQLSQFFSYSQFIVAIYRYNN